MTRYFVLATTLFVSGCATSLPPLDHIQANEIRKIGIITSIDDTPRHTHIGTTVSNNFEKQLDYAWQLEDQFATAIETCAMAKGLSALRLSGEEYSLDDISRISTTKGESWVFEPDGERIRETLVSDLGLDAIVVVDQFENGIAYPFEVNRAEGYGLFTRGAFGITSYFAYNHIRPIIYYLNQPGWLGTLAAAGEDLEFSKVLRGAEKPSDFESITEAELAPVKEAVLDHLDLMIEVTCASLPDLV